VDRRGEAEGLHVGQVGRLEEAFEERDRRGDAGLAQRRASARSRSAKPSATPPRAWIARPMPWP
jgi:hypothetical protein